MAALNRTTTCTNPICRLPHKIALEEAILPVSIPLNEIPPLSSVDGVAGAVLSSTFMVDVGKRLTDVSLRLQSMDASGIRYAIVSLTSPGIEGIFDTTTAVSYARKVNDEIHATYVAPHPTRFGFFACLPMQDSVAAATELERCVTQLGAKGALVNGYSQLDGGDAQTVRYLDEAACEPVWATLARLDVPLYLHPRVPPPGQQRVYAGFPMLAHAAYGFGAETGAHALRLACSGLFDRYPRLQVVLGHAAEALPYLAHRIDHRLAVGVPGASGPHKESVSYYLRNNFLATLSGVRRLSAVRCALEEMGEERVMWSVDYPYESNEDAADWFDGVEGLGEETKRKIAWRNAERIFGIPPCGL
ncbi:amidohydrolase 2 [Phyllosticta capitalensis]|uniref:amidohydrolase 2 n=1 Tax=Phyllosticta capitalensis TaxID=121624 RepID=UPI003130DFE1